MSTSLVMRSHVLATFLVILGFLVSGVSADIVAYYPFEEISGGTTPELAWGKDGSISGDGVTLDSNVPGPLSSGGLSSNAFRFAGSDDFVEANLNGGFNGIYGQHDRSISAWIKHEGNPDGAVLSYGTNNGDRKWVTRIHDGSSNGNVNGALRTEVNGGYEIGSTDLRNDGWHHIAWVWENDGSPNINESRIYIDGTLQTNTGDNGQGVNTDPNNFLQIANDRFSGGRDWNGMIDDVAIYDHALTGAEVTALATGAASPADSLPAPRTVLFDDNFRDTTTGALGATAEATLNAGVAVGTWTVGAAEESTINAKGVEKSLLMDQGNYSLTANFADEGSLINGTVVEMEMLIRRRNNNEKRNFIEIRDADGNVLVDMRLTAPNNNDNNNAIQYDDGSGYVDIVNPSLFWSSGYDMEDLRNMEITFEEDSFSLWLDRDQNGLIDPGEFMAGLSYLETPTAGLDSVLFYGNSEAGLRLNDILAYSYIAAVVPEPSTYLLATFGLLGMGWYIRRKKK